MNHVHVHEHNENNAPYTPADYEEMYASSDRIWSGNPNQNMVDAVRGLTPGTALDIGCGEGADAKWLVEQGWTVTGIDPSATALRRAAELCPSATFIHSTFEDAQLGEYDLIVASYAPLPKDAGVKLARALRPGGTLLILHHEEIHRQSPAEYLMPHNASELLEGWDVTVEKKDRDVQEGRGQHHHADLLAIATRQG